MSKPLFGQILDPDLKPTRDAIHIPIVPVICGTDRFYGGDPINIEKVNGYLVAQYDIHGYAVVDPFLKQVKYGQLFYAWLKPESTQKLWHCWTHRELDKENK